MKHSLCLSVFPELLDFQCLALVRHQVFEGVMIILVKMCYEFECAGKLGLHIIFICTPKKGHIYNIDIVQS